MLYMKLIIWGVLFLFVGMAGADSGWRTEGSMASEWIAHGTNTFGLQLSGVPVDETSVFPAESARTSRSMAILPSISSEILEMAAALEHDPLRIYEFVRNDIAYDHQWMWLRSAERTLVDRMGNAADQAVLLAELLQAAGFVFGYDLYYTRGILELPLDGNNGYNLRNWLGVAGIAEAATLMDQMSWPRAVTPTTLGFPYYWVTAYIDGQWHHLNPSIRPHDWFAPEDVYDLAGYSRTNLLSAAGGTGDTTQISGVSESGVRSYLNTLAKSFHDAVKADYPNSHVKDLFGGKKVVPEIGFGGVRATIWELEYWTTQKARPHYIQFEDILDGSDDPVYFSSAELATDRLTITVDGSGTNGTLFVNDSSYFTGTVAQTDDDCRISFIRPLGYWYSTNWNSHTETYHLAPESTNAVFFSLGHSDNRGMATLQSEQLFESLSNGASSASIRRLAQHIIGNQWVGQKNLAASLSDGLFDDIMCVRYTMGLLENLHEGHSIDMKHILHQPLYTSSTNEGVAVNWATMLFSSALEHGTLEQAQPGSDAVSTVKTLSLAAADTQTVFRVTTNNWDSVEPELDNYLSGELQYLENRLQGEDAMLIVHENGETMQNSWTGNAHIAIFDGRFAASIGTRNGGVNTDSKAIDIEKLRKILEAAGFTPAEIKRILSLEPVDMLTGAYVFDREDLRIDGPLDLTFSRHYSSLQRNLLTPMGYGWTHSFDIHAREHSAPQMGLGLRSPEDAASAALGLCVIKDLLEHEDTAKGWLTAALTANWMMDQLTDNAVTITVGQKGITFIEQPDGSYTAPPGMTVSLTKTNGVYVMSERNSNVYTFNASLRLAEIEDPDGNTLTFAYNAQTNLQSVTSSFGPSMTFSYTSGRLTSVSDSTGRSVEYQYDSSGNLTNFVDAADFEWGIAYGDTNQPHCITALTDPEGITTIQNFYNSATQVTNQVSATSNAWNFYFTGTRNVEEDPYGNQTAYYIDEHGRTWSVEDALTNRSYAYHDGQNHVTNTVDARGVTNIFVFDKNNNLLAQTLAAGTPEQVATHYGYDSLHRLVSLTNALGDVTRYQYDSEHHLTSASNDAYRVNYTHYADGQIHEVTDGRNETTEYFYDSTGLVSRIDYPDGSTVSNVWNARGDLLKTWNGENEKTEFFYDAERHLIGMLDPRGNTATNVYFDNGLLQMSVDQGGRTNQYTFTEAYKLWTQTQPGGDVIYRTYDDADRLTTVVTPESRTTEYEMDAIGQRTNVTYPTAGMNYAFDAAGNITNRTDAMGRETEYIFDGMNRITQIIYPDSSAVSFEYDDLGNLTEVSNQVSEVSLAYDEMNRLESSQIRVHSRSFAVTNSYDLAGNRTAIFYPGNKSVAYTYDENSRLSSVDLSDFGLTACAFAYDAAGRLTNVVYPNGVKGSFDHNANRQVSEYAYGLGGTNFLRHVIQHNALGFKIIEDVYEGLLPVFTNEIRETHTHNDADQLTSIGTNSYSYNLNGCLISGAGVSYSWDYDNRLTEAGSVEYLYDGAGSRVGRIDESTTNYFVLDYADPLRRPLCETDSTGAVTRYYIWQPTGLLAHIEASGAFYFYHADEQGSTLALSDTNGTVAAQYAYSPYGKILQQTGSVETPYVFIGGFGVRHEGGDLYYMLNRYYSTDMRRFISVDPIGIAGAYNLYAYGDLNPVFYIDPHGLWGVQFGENGVNIGIGHPNLIFTSDSAMAASEGAVAALDGINPFGDPLSWVYENEDGSVPIEYRFSRVAGAGTVLAISAIAPAHTGLMLAKESGHMGNAASRYLFGKFWTLSGKGSASATLSGYTTLAIDAAELYSVYSEIKN